VIDIACNITVSVNEQKEDLCELKYEQLNKSA